MPETPERAKLSFVKEEMDTLQKLLSPVVDIITLENPTRQQVLSELPEQQIVHLACHGCIADDPSQSSLYLRDWKTTPLTVSDLQSIDVKSATFAYLSACHSSGSEAVNLLDESITLSSAIQLSGYLSVVGTLWRVVDKHSAEVARDVYSLMMSNGDLNIRRSAEAFALGIACSKR